MSDSNIVRDSSDASPHHNSTALNPNSSHPDPDMVEAAMVLISISQFQDGNSPRPEVTQQDANSLPVTAQEPSHAEASPHEAASSMKSHEDHSPSDPELSRKRKRSPDNDSPFPEQLPHTETASSWDSRDDSFINMKQVAEHVRDTPESTAEVVPENKNHGPDEGHANSHEHNPEQEDGSALEISGTAPSLQIVLPVYTTFEEDEARATEDDKTMHNQKVADFLHLKHDSPDLSLEDVRQFNREWQQNFCVKRRDAGAPKQFLCSSHLLTGTTCDSAQEYGSYSLSRAGISHLFGHNKTEWRQIPLRYRVVLCRKHYQTVTYQGRKHFKVTDEDSYIMQQIKLVRIQIAKILEWRADAKFSIKPTVTMKKRIGRYQELCFDRSTLDDAAKEVNSTSSRGEPEDVRETPVEFAVQLNKAYGKEGQSPDFLLGMIEYIEKQIVDGKIKVMPPFEFLLDVKNSDRKRTAQDKRHRKDIEKLKVRLPLELQKGKRERAAEDPSDEPNGRAGKAAKRRKLNVGPAFQAAQPDAEATEVKEEEEDDDDDL